MKYKIPINPHVSTNPSMLHLPAVSRSGPRKSSVSSKQELQPGKTSEGERRGELGRGKRPAPSRGARRRTEQWLALPLSPSLRRCRLKPPPERGERVLEGQLLCSQAYLLLACIALPLVPAQRRVGSLQCSESDAHKVTGGGPELGWCSCPGVGEGAVTSTFP